MKRKKVWERVLKNCILSTLPLISQAGLFSILNRVLHQSGNVTNPFTNSLVYTSFIHSKVTGRLLDSKHLRLWGQLLILLVLGHQMQMPARTSRRWQLGKSLAARVSDGDGGGLLLAWPLSEGSRSNYSAPTGSFHVTSRGLTIYNVKPTSFQK